MTILKKNIVWIASYPKSGNTWFRLLLSCVLNPEKDYIDINSFDSVFIASDRSIFDRIAGTNSSDLTTDEIYSMRPEVYRMISSENQNTVYIKVHDAWQKKQPNSELFPREITKKVILIVRNPFDLVVSLSNHNGITLKKAIEQINNTKLYLAGNQLKMPPQLCQYIGNWSEHFKSWVDHSGLDVHIMRYEDMLLNPIETFSEALKFLGIEISDNHLISSIRMCSFETLRDQEKKFGFKEKPLRSKMFFNSGIKDQWKDLLDSNEISIVKEHHFEVINRLKYF